MTNLYGPHRIMLRDFNCIQHRTVLDISDPDSDIYKLCFEKDRSKGTREEKSKKDKGILFWVKGSNFISYKEWRSTALGQIIWKEINKPQYAAYHRGIFFESNPIPIELSSNQIMYRLRYIVDYIMWKEQMENILMFSTCILCSTDCIFSYNDQDYGPTMNMDTKMCSHCMKAFFPRQ